MRLRGFLIAVVATGCAAFSGTALADGGAIDVPGVGEVNPDVPQLPNVPGLPPTPDLNPTVDSVVDQLPEVDEVVPSGGGEPAPQPSDPAAAPPAASPDPAPDTGGGDTGGDVAAPPAESAPSGEGTSSPEPDGEARSAGAGDSSAADAGGRDEPAGAAAAGARDRGPTQARRAAVKEEPNLPTRIGDFIAELPTGVLLGLIGLGVIALLMTGRSAWFSRATRNLKLQRRSLQRDVGVLQAALVPDLPPAVGGVGVSVAYRPAAGPAAGGDYHDVFELGDGKIGIVLGDVSGHGREALPRVGVMRYTIRAYLEAGLEPRLALRLADRALSGQFGDGEFASAVAATYDPATRRLVYSCAGHPQPIVVGGDPPSQVSALAAPPIGLGHPSGSRQTTLALDPGSELWIFTDGLIEADCEGRMLGREGLSEMLAERPQPAALLNDVAGDEGRDDLTVCRLQPPDPAEEPQPFSVEALLVEQDYEAEEISTFLRECGLDGAELDEICARIAAERRLEGQVLIRISRLDDVMHWRVERVDPQLGRVVPPVDAAPTSPLAS